jgi:glucans biosynthesis protein
MPFVETRASARGRAWLSGGVAVVVLTLAVVPPAVAAPVRRAFGLDDVAAKAEKLAKESFQDTKGSVPDWLLKISYDQWRDIRFRPDQALWAERPSLFRVQFFHPGLFYDRVVAINVVDEKGVHPMPFSPSKFDYGKNDFASKVPQDLGYAGFRVHYPIKAPPRFDEVIVFLGASYLRAVGARQLYGLSARALAIDTALPSGEEFPYFREFWLVTPAAGAKELTIFALLDSPSATGAYRFVVDPGEQTVVAVESRLFFRKAVKKLGIAPLTSMFYFGENTLRTFPDFRPEVHDSDGMLAHFASGEWLWRPLDNPKALSVNTFQTLDPKGFGLIQRDRTFDHYQDLETRAELRPSTWIAPRSGFGDGAIEIVEIPTTSDVNDNIVSYWVPKVSPKAGDRLRYDYTTYWYGDDPKRPPGGHVVATRHDYGKMENVNRFVLDFSGGKLEAIPASEILRGVVTVLNGEEAATILDQHVVKNEVTGGWRLSFQIQPKTRDILELRAFLDQGGDTLTETWSYAMTP